MAWYAPVFLIYACIDKSWTFSLHRLKKKGTCVSLPVVKNAPSVMP